MQERVHKLLILIGEQGAQTQSRDYKKLSEVVLQYLGQSNQNFNNYFVKVMGEVIRRIPLKQHIYAVLTSEISLKFSNISTAIIENSFKLLQAQLSSGSQYQSINIFQYFAELLNISLLNSSTFMNLVEDVIKAIQNEGQNSNQRKILITVLQFVFPVFAYSLSQKMPHDFKKLVQRIKKLNSKNDLVSKIIKDHSKGDCRDYTLTHRVGTKIQIPSNLQYHTNIKLNIQSKGDSKSRQKLVEYYTFTAQKDQLYQVYSKCEGVFHRNNIERLIQVFYKDSQLLTLKLLNYLIFHQKDQVYLMKFAVETLINKALKGKNSLVECYLLTAICKHDSIGKQGQKTLQQQLLLIFNSFSEEFTLDVLMQFSKLLSYVFNSGVLSVVWDWELYIENASSQKFKKRVIILKIALEDIALLNDKFKPNNLEKYIPENRKNLQEYVKTEDIEIYEAFKQKLGQKSESQVIIPMITQEHVYRIWLEALFQKTSISLTHQQILFKRYDQVFKQMQKDYDWFLIDKIRQFWLHSFSNRMLYLKQIINRNYADYKSYVKYIGQLEHSNQIDEIEVKLQLNQMNKIFGKRLIADKMEVE